MVGHGRFGLVYRGVLHDGKKVVVKLMDRAGKQGEDEFKVEMKLLSSPIFSSTLLKSFASPEGSLTSNCSYYMGGDSHEHQEWVTFI